LDRTGARIAALVRVNSGHPGRFRPFSCRTPLAGSSPATISVPSGWVGA